MEQANKEKLVFSFEIEIKYSPLTNVIALSLITIAG
jgi:hypothetical protein